MSTRTPSSPLTRSTQGPSIGALPSSSIPSSTKNAMAASRSSTTTLTWSSRRIVTAPSMGSLAERRCRGQSAVLERRHQHVGEGHPRRVIRAVAAWVLVEVLLVEVLGVEESVGVDDLGRDLAEAGGRQALLVG